MWFSFFYWKPRFYAGLLAFVMFSDGEFFPDLDQGKTPFLTVKHRFRLKNRSLIGHQSEDAERLISACMMELGRRQTSVLSQRMSDNFGWQFIFLRWVVFRLWIQYNWIDIYSFENTCKEDSDLFLKDGTAKIFLNANGSKIEGEPVGRCTQGDP